MVAGARATGWTVGARFVQPHSGEGAPSFPHGGGSVPYSGQGRVERGAFAYKGPCPPGQHGYQWTIEAQDGAGETLATATAMKKFPSG
jgi:phosphatidylethanolamine-binding protein (PEBP) family uncharacterized protein